MKSLGNRIAVVAGISAAAIIVLLALVISITIRNTFTTFENLQAVNLRRGYDLLIRTQVESAVSLLDYHHSRHRSGSISLDEARRDAADALRELRYGEEGYFWADTVEGVNVVLLGRDTEGTDRLNASDVKGFDFIREIIDMGMQPGGGYTDYWFPRSAGGEAELKRGYSLLYEPFGWVVGTGNYIDDIAREVAALRDANIVRFRRLLITLATVSIVSISLFSVLIVALGRRLTRPLGTVSTALTEIAKGAGNLTQRLLVTSVDEVGAVARSFDEFVASLQQMVDDIKGATGTLGELGQDLSSNMTETAAAVNEITANIESVKRQVRTQGEQVDTTASSVEELTRNIDALNEQVSREVATIDATTQTIGAMLTGVEQMLASAGTTRTQLETLHAKIDHGNRAAAEMGSAVEQMAERSKHLQEANSFVVGIASQTNLLAMNAAIEAAHAGESGRGFSVVAEEIRKLADQAAEQSKRIAEEIRGMEHDIGVSVAVTDEARRLFGEIHGTVSQVDGVFSQLAREVQDHGEAGRTIRDALQELTDIASAVHTGASEMSRANEQILRVVAGLNEATLRMQASMDEIVTGTQEINSSVNNINEISNTNREMILDIGGLIGRFET
ncbi:MAG: methyl-accepting chemotaxis protein [Spirochaetales bacterium]|nr:methyl-accepting chemotaxis protein [Spirochaetales bacterium]